MQAYCVKCETKVDIVNEQEFTMKNGRKAVKGNCPTCNRVVCRILGMARPGSPQVAKKDSGGGCGC